MDAREYLERVGAARERPSAGALARLHFQHLLTVPFENLDISFGVPIEVDEAGFLDKVVRRRRGGFCYELNGAFAWLLRELGYRATLLSAEVARDDGTFGIPFDHMTLEVRAPDAVLLADVGFGESFREPVPFEPDRIHEENDFRFRLRRIASDTWLLERSATGSEDFSPQYRFSRVARKLSDYRAGCEYHQTSPQSTFTQKTVVTRATSDGRITLLSDRLMLRAAGQKSESVVSDQDEWHRLLNEYFSIELERKFC